MLSCPASPHPKWDLDRFSRFCIAHGRESLYFTVVCPFPWNLPLAWGSGSHLIRGSLGPPTFTTQTASPSVPSVFAALTRLVTTVTDRPTERPRYSVCSNSAAMRPKINKREVYVCVICFDCGRCVETSTSQNHGTRDTRVVGGIYHALLGIRNDFLPLANDRIDRRRFWRRAALFCRMCRERCIIF